MAKKPAKKAAKGKGRPASRKGMRSPWVWMMVFVVALIFFPETVLIFVCGMVPSIVALLVDNNPRKHAFRTVSYLNASGTFIVAFSLWQTGDSSIRRSLEMLADPLNWMIMFGMAGLGWTIFYSIPPIVLAAKTLANEMKMKKLKERQLELTKEWGTEVMATAPDIPVELIADAEEAMKPLAEQRRKAEAAEAEQNGEQRAEGQ